MLRFAAAIAEPARRCCAPDATGFDLTPLYPKLPAELNGLVELAYDTDNQAQMRFMEPLVYQSPAYTEDAPVGAAVLGDRHRAPVHPQHAAPGLPGRAGAAASRSATRAWTSCSGPGCGPPPLAQLRDALELDDAPGRQLRRPADRPAEPGRRPAHRGRRPHPLLRPRLPGAAVAGSGDRHRPVHQCRQLRQATAYTLDDLPDYIDLVLITHGHQDHIVLETLLQLRGRVGAVVVPRSSRGNLADPSIGLMPGHLGFPVIEVDDFDEVAVPRRQGRGDAVPRRALRPGHPRASRTYWVELARQEGLRRRRLLGHRPAACTGTCAATSGPPTTRSSAWSATVPR